MSLLTPYLFSGSVSLYFGYKLYNSYYTQPFQYLEIEDELIVDDKEIDDKEIVNKKINGTEIIEILEEKDCYDYMNYLIYQENNETEKVEEEVLGFGNDFNVDAIDDIKEEEIVEEIVEEEVFGFGSDFKVDMDMDIDVGMDMDVDMDVGIDIDEVKEEAMDVDVDDIKCISNKIVDNIINKARNDTLRNDTLKNVGEVKEVGEVKNELSIKDELFKLQCNNNQLKTILEKVEVGVGVGVEERIETRTKKPRKRRRPKKK